MLTISTGKTITVATNGTNGGLPTGTKSHFSSSNSCHNYGAVTGVLKNNSDMIAIVRTMYMKPLQLCVPDFLCINHILSYCVFLAVYMQSCRLGRYCEYKNVNTASALGSLQRCTENTKNMRDKVTEAAVNTACQTMETHSFGWLAWSQMWERHSWIHQGCGLLSIVRLQSSKDGIKCQLFAPFL